MQPNRLEIRGDEFGLILNHQPLDQGTLASLIRLINVYAGDDVYGTDAEACVFDFGDRYWVLPDDFPGISEVIQRFGKSLSESGRALEGQMAAFPGSWYKKFLGLFTFHFIRPGVHTGTFEIRRLKPIEWLPNSEERPEE